MIDGLAHHRNPEYHRTRLRTLEWAAHQRVSILELTGLAGKTKGSRRRLAALKKIGSTTADSILDASEDALVASLFQLLGEVASESKLRQFVVGWKPGIIRLKAERDVENSELMQEDT